MVVVGFGGRDGLGGRRLPTILEGLAIKQFLCFQDVQLPVEPVPPVVGAIRFDRGAVGWYSSTSRPSKSSSSSES